MINYHEILEKEKEHKRKENETEQDQWPTFNELKKHILVSKP